MPVLLRRFALLMALLPVLLPAGCARRAPVAKTGEWSVTPGACLGGEALPGRFCYQAAFRLPPDAPEDLALFLPQVHDSDETWLNRHFIGATGRRPPQEIMAGGYRRAYALRESWLLAGGDNEIMVDVHCGGRRCGPDGPARVMKQNAALFSQWSHTVFSLLIAGCLCLAALFFMIFGWNRVFEYQNIWFGIFIFCGALDIAVHEPAWAAQPWQNPLFRFDHFAGMLLFPLYARFLLAALDRHPGRGGYFAGALLMILPLAVFFIPLQQVLPFTLIHRVACALLMIAMLIRLLIIPAPQSVLGRLLLISTSLLLTLGAGLDLQAEWGLYELPVEWLDNYMPLSMLASALLVTRVLALRYRRLERTAYHDPLTGLNSRRFMDEFIAVELARAARLKLPVSMLFIDIDNFKKVNDQHGHAAGDLVLKELANRMNSLRRAGDLLCRWGGEEFALFIIGQPLSEAGGLADRLRESIAATPFEIGGGKAPLKITISIGAASLPIGDGSLPKLVGVADAALYRAKHEGRNRVVIADAVAA